MYPKTIKIAAVLFVLSIIAAAISAYIDYQSTQQAAERQVIMFIALVFLVPYVILFSYMMKKRNWARIVWLTIFVLGTLLRIFNPHQVQYAHVSLRYFATLQALLQVMITVLLFLPPSNRWFRQRDVDSSNPGN